MTNRLFLFIVMPLFSLMGLLSCHAGGPRLTTPQRPLNIVLILTDDQGAHLSALGTPGLRTPHVDGLARAGRLFTQAFAAVASCSPSRSAIMTGMYPHANGHWRNTITPRLDAPDSEFSRQSTTVDAVGVHEYIRTLPEVLSTHGYFTGITQKFHMSPPWKFPYQGRSIVHNDPAEFRMIMEAFIDQAGDRPFFVQANISPPHRNFDPHLAAFPAMLPDAGAVVVPPYLADVPAVRADWNRYLGCVQLADACAGAVLDVLRERGLTDRTLIIFTGDQGAPYHRAKASAYYAGLHVPLVISGPGVRAGEVDSTLVSLLDLMPTILDYAQLPIPETVQGISLYDRLRGRAPATGGRRYVFGEHNSHGPPRAEHYPSRMVFDGRYYYIRNLQPGKEHLLPADLTDEARWGNRAYAATVAAADSHPQAYALLRQIESGRPPEELYDMRTDPGQLHNLASQAAYAAIRQRLAAALTEWRRTTGDSVDDPARIPTRLSAPGAGR